MTLSASSKSSAAVSTPSCHIDHDILNKDTIAKMDDIALSFFASACGKNRGAFVVDPPDGKTYGCLSFPKDIAKLAGIQKPLPEGVVIDNANAIKEQFVAGNTTATDTVALLEFLVEQVYRSSPNLEITPYACEFNGLAKLECPAVEPRSPRTDGLPIRSVSMAGIFLPAPWATGGKELSLKEASSFYTLDDFLQIRDLGLNTVQLAVPTAAFTPKDIYGEDVLDVLKGIMKDVDKAGLQIILNLVATGDELDAVVTASEFAANHPVVLALTLPKGMITDTTTVVESIRAVTATLPLFVPLNEGDLTKLKGTGFASDPNVFGSLELSHTVSVADIASSSSQEDRSKLFYHEAIACMVRSPLEYSGCFQDMPLFLSSGFDLSIDDCFNQGGPTFKDYGQCDRFEETVGSGWWMRHRISYAARQLFAAERGLGWSFATWKLYGNDNVGVIDEPVKLLSLQDVVKAGLFPSLDKEIPAQSACLNPPENDFMLGDDTLSPTQGPPPDCGNGWWNYTTEKCDYWIPPPPPTMAPTEPCPECACSASAVLSGQSDTLPLVWSGLGGAAVMLVVVMIYNLVTGRNKRNEYSTIPN
ncbi:hypothetical protein IV203_007816 [Nitzschia inconspicua]|uniref:Uncharacterized protein n=1 Tax=Nitzschia inconspicua TaxID=303405 RepID=A0A9K3KYY3_9STRA|nr:hypothetical protein IV203_007816 [Nitzschia inconspicua]